MSDLISRQELYHEMTVKSMELFENGLAWHEFRRGFDFAMEFVQEAPTAEPDRKKGRWEVQPSTGEDRPFIWWKCSECGHVIFSETERDRKEFHAFCGRCGADMRGE